VGWIRQSPPSLEPAGFLIYAVRSDRGRTSATTEALADSGLSHNVARLTTPRTPIARSTNEARAGMLLLEQSSGFTKVVIDTLLYRVGNEHWDADRGARSREAERADQEVAARRRAGALHAL
jgi:hypothetical protein